MFAGTWSISHTRHLNVGHGSSSPSPSSAASTSSSSTGSSSRQRRKSGDDILHQQQASSPSRKPATILDAFRPRSKSDASRTKKPGSAGSTIISQMKSAMQVFQMIVFLWNCLVAITLFCFECKTLLPWLGTELRCYCLKKCLTYRITCVRMTAFHVWSRE